MNSTATAYGISLLMAFALSVSVVHLRTTIKQLNSHLDREMAVAKQLDDCARKENVYPTSCQMQAVVIKPRLLEAPRVEVAGHE